MKKICMLSLTHSLKDDRIFYKESLSLKRQGYEVVHIGGVDVDGKIKDMGGKILNESGESSMFIEGIKCIGIPLPPGFMQNIFKKFFLGFFYRDFIQTAVSESADIYHAHEPQAYFLALKIAKLTGAKVIYDAHESWLSASLKDKYIKWRYLKKMTFLISANGMTRDSLVAKNPNIKSEIIANASVINGSAYIAAKEIIIAHEGSFPFNRGLKLFLTAIELLRKKTSAFSVKIVGGFAEEENRHFQSFTREHQMQEYMNVTGWKPYELVADELEGASIGVILNTPTLNNIYAGPPNKLFNYIAKNMCVVAVELPETVRVINKYSCGVVLKNREPGHLAEVLYKLIMDPNLLREKQLAAHEAHKVLNWEMESQKLLKFYDSVFSD